MKFFKAFGYHSQAFIVFAWLFMTVFACKKTEPKNTTDPNGGNNNPTDTPSIIHYKNSDHAIFVGFLVGDGNDPYESYNPANAPDSIDYLEFFAGRDSVSAHWRTAQEKGTKIVVCHFLSDAYFDGSIKDPRATDSDYVIHQDFSRYTSTTTSSYNHWAQAMFQKHIVEDRLDGIDLDVESGTFGGDVRRIAANGDSLMVAVARYFGPKSTAGNTAAGRKPVFFYDTDGSGGFETAMCINHKDNYDYILFQSYTTGSHYWSGTGVGSLPNLVNTYGKEKLVFLVNGDSFTYPDGSEDQPGGNAKASQDLLDYAQWVKENGGAGVGAYRMSRDYNHTPPFAVSRQAMQIMNPAK